MKNLFCIISILSSVSSFGQCVNLYINKHISGHPICRLSEGGILELCLEDKKVSGGNCDFYILQVKDIYGGLSIDLALDRVAWAPKYGELIISYTAQKVVFSIGNNTGTYSYYNEAEIDKIREGEKIEQEKQKQELLLSDKKITEEINLALKNNQFFKAYSLLSSLNFENKELTNEVNQKFEPLKNEIDLLYKDYLNDFELFKTKRLQEYSNNSSEFIEKNKEFINKVNIQFQGFDNINSALEKGLKANDLACLVKSDNKHIFLPLGFEYHIYSKIFDTLYADQIILSTNYNHIKNEIEPELSVYKNNVMRYKFKIINPQFFNINSINFSFSDKLNEKFNSIKLEGGSRFIENNYQQKAFLIDSKEIISFMPKNASEPKDGYQNNEFNDLYSIYSETLLPLLKTFLPDKPDFSGVFLSLSQNLRFNFLINPSLLSKIQKITDKSSCDSIIMIFGKDLPKTSNTIELVVMENGVYYSGERCFYFLPLKKGSIELINEKNVRIYNTDGNYKDYQFDILCETFTREKINQLLAISGELKKKLKKNTIDFDYSSFFSIDNTSKLKWFVYTNDIIIPRLTVYGGGLPSPDKLKIVVNK